MLELIAYAYIFLRGGLTIVYSLLYTLAQSMLSKKGCFLISSASVAPAPNLLLGFLFKSYKEIKKNLS